MTTAKKDAEKTYVVVAPVRWQGKRHPVGSQLELTDDELKAMPSGVVELAKDQKADP